MKKLLSTLALLMAFLYASADRMYINDFSIEAGETKQVSVHLQNVNTWSGFQLELYLPEGLTMATDARGRLRSAVNADRADDHTLTFSDRGNGQYNAIYYSVNSYDIYGNDGEIVSFWVKASDDFKGTSTISLKRIIMSDADGEILQLDDASCTVTGPAAPDPQPGSNVMSIADFSIEAGETKQVSVNLQNENTWSGFQFELYLPEGLTMATDARGRLRSAVNADRADDHTLTFSDRGNGQYNAIYYSVNSYDIYGNDGEIVSFWVKASDDFKGTSTISLKRIIMSDANGEILPLDDASCTVTGPAAPDPQPGSNVMSIDDFTINAGETKQVSINLHNDNTWSGFQFELYLPEGLTMAKDSKGRLRSAVNADRADDHTLTFSDRGNGQYNAIYYSVNSYNIYGNDGEIVSFWVTAASNMSGSATINLKKIIMSDSEGEILPLADATCTVTVEGGAPEPDKATSIKLDLESFNMNEASMMLVMATVEPATAVQQVKWQSSNVEVVTVDDLGRIKAIAPGEATITATTTDGSNLSASCEVAVLENGDMNADRIVDVTDVTLLINKIIR